MRTVTKILCLSLLCLFVMACQEDDEDPTRELLLETGEIELSPGSSAEIEVVSGFRKITARSSNEDIVKAEVVDNVIRLTALEFREYAEVIVYVSDGLLSRTSLLVRVANFGGLRVAQEKVVLPQLQTTDTLQVTGLNKGYAITASEPGIAEFSVVGDQLVIKARKRGKTVVTIEDKYSGSAQVEVDVEGAKMSLDFGDRIFGYAAFDEIAVVDKSVRSLQQVTFEMTCKLDGYRGLQTFMGLEGQLIVRGKNDDYREDHPIQIAGLGDRIMLESTRSFNLHEWLHIALVVDCSQAAVEDQYTLYINGVQDPLIIRRNEETHRQIDLASSNDGNRFVIGRAYGQDWRVIRGMVSEARVWTVARTATQIAENQCELKEMSPEGLLAHWDFSSGVSTDHIPDISGGKYALDLKLSDARKNGMYYPMTVSKELFLTETCE